MRFFYWIVLLPFFLFSSEWYKLAGKYAEVEYLQEHKEIADSILNIADRVLPELSANHGYAIEKYLEDKCRIIFTDAPDISNGFAVGNTIVIYGTSSAYLSGWTGQKNWYDLVVKHELAHHVTMRALKRKASFFGLVTLAAVPRWFFEGIAQYFAEDWTLTRGDIYLQNAVLQSKLDYTVLTNLNDGRLLYASAHGFVRFLADQYGDSSLIKLMAYNKDGWFYDFEKAFKHTFQKSSKSLFLDFVKHTTIYYGSKLAQYPVNKFKEISSFPASTRQIVPFNFTDSVIVTGVEKNDQYYLSAWVAKLDSSDKLIAVDKILSNFNSDIFISPDDQFIAYAQADYSVSKNLNSIKFDWYFKNIKSGTETTVAEKIRARFAAFDNKNRFYLTVVESNSSSILRFATDSYKVDTLITSDFVFGRISFDATNNLFVEAQKKDGYRNIFRLTGSILTPISDLDDLSNLQFISPNKALVNHVENELPSIYLINLQSGNFEKLLNDREPLFIKAYDKNSDQLILSGLDYDRSFKFFSINPDTLFSKKLFQENISVKPKYSSWTKITAPQIKPNKNISENSKPNEILFPQGKLEHGFSFAWPVFDNNAGSGLFATTTWFDPLQRHALNFSAVGFIEKPDESVVAYTHFLKALNQDFILNLYHGPVIFSYDNNSYEKLYNVYLSAGIRHKRFTNGNINYPLKIDLFFNYFRYFNSAIYEDYHFYGPQVGLSWESRLLTEYRNFLPERLFNISSIYFKSLKNDYDFSVLQNDIKIAKNLFSSEIGVSVAANYTKTFGQTPPLQLTGIDRFYEFDTPRDVRYTKSIRGIDRDIFGKELFYGQIEISWLLARRTNLKLIFLPMNYPLLTGFFDIAEISTDDKIRVYSYGIENTFGDSFLRFGAGYVVSKYDYLKKEENFYLRLKLILPDL